MLPVTELQSDVVAPDAHDVVCSGSTMGNTVLILVNLHPRWAHSYIFPFVGHYAGEKQGRGYHDRPLDQVCSDDGPGAPVASSLASRLRFPRQLPIVFRQQLAKAKPAQ